MFPSLFFPDFSIGNIPQPTPPSGCGSIVNLGLNQPAVIWDFVRFNMYGSPIVSSEPRLVWVRWINKKIEIQNIEEATISIDAVVKSNQEFLINSIMFQGTLEDIPEDITEISASLKIVVTCKRTPTFDGKSARYSTELSKYSNNSFPETE